ncbi:ribonuclease Z [Caproiciproducens sp. MSJ-32]|uniref:ribonuclease Z n=1 Tax=Caproiciproducens sp. MSJ-32 TaxID=2841527 RepID=UPI001C0FAE7D|nr:ribonuclease Z [Caproiciproducens sp. MSJ-32]MBU5455947.1 ribonuclease Z [Caproiciproducens sp. MSJ-32]
MVDISLLGCGGGMPVPNRFLSSLLINYLGRKILIDCGEGTQVSMKLLGTGFKTIDIICITHGHGDHIVGLPGLLATIGNSGRVEPLTIIGPAGIEEIIKGLRVIIPYLPYEIKIIEKPRDTITLIENINITSLELDHSAPCLGYSFYFKRKPRFNIEAAKANKVPKILWNKLQKGESLIYEGIKYEPNMVLGKERRGIKFSFITDTRPIKEIIDFIKESDLLVCEGTYGDDNDIKKAIKNKHMTFSEAAKLAREGEVKELMLTHFSPAMKNPEEYIENARKIFKNTVLGEDRITKTLSFVND